MAQGRELEKLFIKLFVDDSDLRPGFKRASELARAAADDLSRAFETSASKAFEDSGVRVEASARRQRQAVSELAPALERVKNETASLRNTTEAGTTTNADAIRRFTELRDESLRLAQGLDVTSKEYRGFTQAAAQASRSIKTLEGETTKLGFSANNAVGVSAALRQNIGLLGPAGTSAARGLGLVQASFTGFAATGPGVTGQLDGIVRGFTRLSAVLPLVAAGATVAAIAGLNRLANASATIADEIDKGAARAGVSAEAYQELRFAFDQSGVSATQFDTALQNLNRRLGQAAEGNASYARSFASLGVAIRDANNNVRSTEEVFNDVFASIARLPSASEQAAAAAGVFGDRVGASLLPALREGVDGFNALRRSARDLGLVISGEAIISLVDYKDQVGVLQRQFETARVEIAAGFLPVLRDVVIPLIQNTLVPLFQNAAQRVSDFARGLSDTGEDGRKFRAEMVANIAPLVAFGQAAVGVGAVVVGAFSAIIAGTVQLGQFLGTLVAEIERDATRTLSDLAVAVATPLAGFVFEPFGLLPGQSTSGSGGRGGTGSAIDRASEAARIAAQSYYEASLNAFELAGDAFTFDLEKLLDEIAETTSNALERGAGNLFGDAEGGAGGEGARQFLEGSLAALRQELNRAEQAYAEAGDAAGRAFQQAIIAGIKEAIAAIEAEIRQADPFADARRWTERLAREFAFGVKDAVEVFDLISPRAEELRAQIQGLLQAGDFDSPELEVLIGQLAILDELLRAIGPVNIGTVDLSAERALTRYGFTLEALAQRGREASNALRDARIAEALEVEQAVIARNERALVSYGFTLEALARAGRESSTALRDSRLAAELAAQEAAAGRAERALRRYTSSLEALAQIGRAAAVAQRAPVPEVPLIEAAYEELQAALRARQEAITQDQLVAANARVRIAEEELRRLRELGSPFQADGQFGPQPLAVPEFQLAPDQAIRAELVRSFEVAATAAGLFGTEAQLASEKVRLVESAMQSLIALDPSAELSDLVALWTQFSTEAGAVAEALAEQERVTREYEGALERLSTLAGETPSQFELIRAAFEAAADAAVITTGELESLIATLEKLESVSVRDEGLQSLASNIDLGTAIVDGISDSLSAIRLGDLPGALSGLTSLGAAIGTAIGGPAVGALVASIGGFLQSLGRLFGIGGSNVPDDLDRTRAPGAAARGAPSVQLTFQQFNSASFESLGDTRLQGFVDEVAQRTIDVLERSVLPRLTSLEERVA